MVQNSIGFLAQRAARMKRTYLAQKFARVVIGTNNIDCCARVCHTPTAAAMKLMLGTGVATNSYNDIEEAQTILICGANATENHPIVGARIKQAALSGAKLIVIDSRQIELAHYATIHLQPQPGTNIPLLMQWRTQSWKSDWWILNSPLNDVAEWDEFCEFIERSRPRRPRTSAKFRQILSARQPVFTQQRNRRCVFTVWE